MRASSIGLSAAAYLASIEASRVNFYDDFSRTGEDTDIWTSGGDGGTFASVKLGNLPTAWRLTTGGVIDNDWYIHGDANIKNKVFQRLQTGYSTVTWLARLSLGAITDISALWGLLNTVITDYAEPADQCAHFLVDPTITNTFRARSYAGGAEEETDTLIALDGVIHEFKIVWTAGSVRFYIDTVLVVTHLVRIPNSGLVSEILVRTEAAAPRYLTVERVYVELS